MHHPLQCEETQNFVARAIYVLLTLLVICSDYVHKQH